MLIVITGGDEESQNALVHELSKHADFETVSPKSYSFDDLLSSNVGKYKPGSDTNLVTFDFHWRNQLDEDEFFLTQDFELMELFLASRGAVTVVLSSSNPLVDAIHRQSLIAIEDHELIVGRGASIRLIDPEAIIAQAQNQEAEAQSLDRWGHYVGSVAPKFLYICRPDRQMRLSILALVGEEDPDWWHDTGIASSASSVEEMELLWGTLGNPKLYGVGILPPHMENFLSVRGATFLALT